MPEPNFPRVERLSDVGRILLATLSKSVTADDDARAFRQATLNLLEDAIQARNETLAMSGELDRRMAELRSSELALRETRTQLQQAIARFESLKNDFHERVQERTAEFERREQWLQESAARIKNSELRERHRLARLLHDQVQQLLVAAKMKLSVISDQSTQSSNPALRDVMTLLDDAVDLTRDVSVRLAPPLLHEEGLPAAIKWLVSRMERQFQLKTQSRIDEWANPESADARDVLFQAAQEFLLNSAKHAQTERVKLKLIRSRVHVRLTVRDFGQGCRTSPLREQGSYGLLELDERLRWLGGWLRVDSRPEQGTCVTAFVPEAESTDRPNFSAPLIP